MGPCLGGGGGGGGGVFEIRQLGPAALDPRVLDEFRVGDIAKLKKPWPVRARDRRRV